MKRISSLLLVLVLMLVSFTAGAGTVRLTMWVRGVSIGRAVCASQN